MTQNHYRKSLPPKKTWQTPVFIVDQLAARKNAKLSKWLNQFERVLKVPGGEGLKDLDAFAQYIKKIQKLSHGAGKSEITIVGIGGGSVTDFAGFVASILKRGVKLDLIPSTWLAAVDSAHLGKNGLNVGRVKNQVGTIYQPENVFLIKDLLLPLSEEHLFQGQVEAMKIGLLRAEVVFVEALQSQAKDLWELLPRLIRLKHEVVGKDFDESLGERFQLNLGHTWGHVLESHYGYSHGRAVFEGLEFSVQWSSKKGYLEKPKAEKIISSLQQCLETEKPTRKLTRAKALQLLGFDKKSTQANKINFVFLTDIGKARVQSVTMKQIITEATRQGWIRRA
jgi:3-dehydroquinate synthase